MKQKHALAIALSITMFVLVAVSSIALAWPALQRSQKITQEATLPATPLPALDANADAQTLLATVQARDAAYQAQIKQANQQLNDAYQRLQELKTQNQLLLEREQIYRQRLQESAQIIDAISNAQSASQPPIAFQQESHHDND